MHRRQILLSVPLALGALAAGCATGGAVRASLPVRLGVFVYPAPVEGGCATFTSPQYIRVQPNADIVWEIINVCGRTLGNDAITIEFGTPGIVDVDNSPGHQKKGKVKGTRGLHKYSVRLKGGPTEDPELEIRK